MTDTRHAPVSDEAMALARAHEHDRYLAATLAPEAERAALIALAGFSADIRRIVSAIKEPLLAEIRLQWWRDSLDTLAKGGRTGAPLADAVGDAMAAYALPALEAASRDSEPLIAEHARWAMTRVGQAGRQQ